jgi:hypothetical protein
MNSPVKVKLKPSGIGRGKVWKQSDFSALYDMHHPVVPTVLYACHQGPLPKASTVRMPTTASNATRPLYSSPSNCSKQHQHIGTTLTHGATWTRRSLPASRLGSERSQIRQVGCPKLLQVVEDQSLGRPLHQSKSTLESFRQMSVAHTTV